MYKFTVLAIVAFAACQVLAAPIEDDSETALLMGQERLFSDFCHESRNLIFDDIKRSTTGASSFLFKQFFGGANEIAEEVLDVEKKAIEELSEQIRDPGQSIPDAPLEEDEIAVLIDDGKQEIQRQSIAGAGIIPGVKTAAMAMFSTVNSALFTRLAKARSFLSAHSLSQGIQNTCNKMADYEKQLEANLSAAKEKIASENAGKTDVEQFLSTVTLPSLHCQTTKNVARLNAFCELYKSGKNPFRKMLGLGASTGPLF